MNPGETAPDRQASVLAVILNWNGASDTLRCAQSVIDQTGATARVLVVDNGSSDDSLARLRQAIPPLEVLALDENQGFTGGMNAGTRRAISGGFEFTWLVNNDAFPRPTCLKTLLDRMRGDQKAAMVAPRLLSPDGTEQTAGGTIDWSTSECAYLRAAEFHQPVGPDEWLSGTAPLIRTSALAGADPFESGFFAYMEDVDLSFRLARAGGTLHAVANAEAVHVGGATSGGATSPVAQFLCARNGWLVLERNRSSVSPRARWLRFAANAMRRAALFEHHGRPDLSNAVLAGISAARRRQFGPPPAAPQPALLESVLSKRPWRSIQVMNQLAHWLDGLGAPPAQGRA
jgi:GT2 family glycosyltransferase